MRALLQERCRNRIQMVRWYSSKSRISITTATVWYIASCNSTFTELETRVRDSRLESDSSRCFANLRLAWDLPVMTQDLTRDLASKTWDLLETWASWLDTWASWLDTWRHRLEPNCFRGYRRITYIYTKISFTNCNIFILRLCTHTYSSSLAPWPLPE